MTDKLTKEQRSYNMSQIKSKDTKPEIAVRHALHHLGYRYRKNDKRLPGKPDIYLPKYKTVIFINGCFWHGHEGCRYYVIPKTNTEYWIQKIRATKIRDNKNIELLISMGFKIIVLWECEIKTDINRVVNEIILSINNT